MKTILVLIAAALLSPSVLFGQKLMKEGGMFIIDLSNMDSRVITKTHKTPTTTATNTAMGSKDDDISSAKSNETLYYKFEIIEEQVWRKGATWKDAIDICSKYERDGRKNWRLPTQKEVLFLGVLHSSITSILGCEALVSKLGDKSDSVWAATEFSETLAWRSIPKTDGEVLTFAKSTQMKFVCIREIP